MTRDEAKAIFRGLGVVDPGDIAALHVAYCRYIDLLGRGECGWLPASEAYAILSKKEMPTAQEQLALFVAKNADL